MASCRPITVVGLLLGLALASGGPARTQTAPKQPAQKPPTAPQKPPVQPGMQQQQQLPPLQPQIPWLAFRNDTTVGVMVRTEGLDANGFPWRGNARLINQREASWEPLPCLGQKRITIYDTRGQILFQQFAVLNVQFSLYLIKADLLPDKTVRFRLVPGGDPRITLPAFPNMTPAPAKKSVNRG